MAGGAVSSGMGWLYPYDGTVFPQGLDAPLLQWSQTGTPSALYLHLHSSQFDYKGCFAGTSQLSQTIPAGVWSSAVAQSLGASDPLTVELTTITSSTVSGPITEHLTIALGTLKGVVDYDTYNSPIATAASGQANGAVMQLKPGSSAPTALLAIAGTIPTGPCISCHSLSANGSTLAAQKHFYPGGLSSPGSMTFNLASGFPTATSPTPLASTTSDDWGMSAVYPDGSLLLTAGEPQDSTQITALFPVNNDNNPGMIGPKRCVMYATSTGSTIAFSGLADATAMMPSWSVDGRRIVFNDVTNHAGHALVVQDFDASTKTFSNAVVIYQDASGYPGWPTFTPDGASVVFAMGASNYSSIPPSSFSSVGPVQSSASDVASSDLYIVRVPPSGGATGGADGGLADAGADAMTGDAGSGDAGASPQAQALALANGFRGGTSYLPFGARDQHLGFYPNVSPVASGGYYWIVFMSRRQYGNAMVDTTNNDAVPDPVWHAETKKVWVTAISIGGSGDPSHPAFLLPGQEASSGVYRPIATLSAGCAATAHSCASGIDCCSGFCVSGACASTATCSHVDDKCATKADCCDAANRCLGGYCAVVTP
jgi:hypothetical protein